MSDAVFSLDGGLDFSDRVELKFGQRGFLTLELKTKSAGVDIHSKYEGIVPSAAWRLLWAISSLRSSEGEILVPGFYDKVEEPSKSEMALIEEICSSTLPREKLFKEWGLESFRHGFDEKQALSEILFQPTANINGFNAGYQGPGVKTIIPSEAEAKMDFMLVPHQDPDEVFEAIVHFLNEGGFKDIEVNKIVTTKPGKVSFETDLAQACRQAAKEVYGTEATVLPINPGYAKSGPWIANRLGIGSGVHNGIAGPMPCNQHAPNEFLGLDHFKRGIKYVSAVMSNYASHA
jgi:acetylornithine deacetylase/succinyl-diaminopimelate desuccinylase-like protein